MILCFYPPLSIKNNMSSFVSPDNSSAPASQTSNVVIFSSHSEDRTDDVANTCNVLSRYCLPISSSGHESPNHDSCRFMPRNCMFWKHKLSADPPLSLNSSCTYTKLFPNNTNQSSFDCRLIKCFNSKCNITDENGISSTRFFHFCCYLNMLSKNDKDASFTHIKVNTNNVYKFFPDDSIERPTIDTVILTHNEVILPVCCKRCYNTVNFAANNNSKSSKKSKKNSETTSNWDNDGDENCRSSEKVLVDWLTDERNYRLYFGGTNKYGKTNGKTKKQYHKEIQDLIFKENGKFKWQTLNSFSTIPH